MISGYYFKKNYKKTSSIYKNLCKYENRQNQRKTQKKNNIMEQRRILEEPKEKMFRTIK